MKPELFLVLKFGAMGDLLMATALVRALREARRNR